MWVVLDTAEFREWRETLSDSDKARLLRLQQLLEREGPTLGRPHADSVSGSKHSNMKELRPSDTVRAFFVFDPDRRAILLCGGDKAGRKERSWYKKMVRQADAVYSDYLAARS